ncbi:hypothetical protein KBTX_04469 [wastewater metagenome]|uniref:Uncharacterized protein n=2 Tax=unclassified sequences TaxID=12908 RepID=A0A5B8RHI8_9ZZZZ|nr:hypothetical protein KBTEX_04469 [uncultured organism]
MRFLDNPYGKTGNVIFLIAIHARHFRCFPANERRTGLFAAFSHSGNNHLNFFRFERTASHIIEKIKRFRPLGDNIIDTHGHSIYADGIVASCFKSKHKLCPDTVRSGNKHRFFHIKW